MATAAADTSRRHATPRTRTPRRVGLVCCAVAMAVLGGSVPITRTVLTYPNATGQGMRYSIAALMLIPLALHVRRHHTPIRRDDWARMTAIAACSLVAFNLFLLQALRHSDPAIVATILGCAPIALGVIAPLVRRQPPAQRIIAAAVIVVAGTAMLNGLGRIDPVGIACGIGALTADLAFSLLAAPMLSRLGPITVAAWTCALAVPMFATVAAIDGEFGRWRLPHASQALAFLFLGIVLTALAFLAWLQGLRRIGTASAGITIGVVPIAAVATTCVLSAALPTIRQIGALSLVITGLALATGSRPFRIRILQGIRPAAVAGGCCLPIIAAACTATPSRAPDADSPDLAVRAYFAALAEGDTATARQQVRSSTPWLSTGALTRGYQPPLHARVTDVTRLPATRTTAAAIITVRYTLTGAWYQSAIHVQHDTKLGPHWTITAGSTGYLELTAGAAAAHTHITVAGLDVTTMLHSPTSGQPLASDVFELPPGVYTINVANGTTPETSPLRIEVPAMAPGENPIKVTAHAGPSRDATSLESTAEQRSSKATIHPAAKGSTTAVRSFAAAKDDFLAPPRKSPTRSTKRSRQRIPMGEPRSRSPPTTRPRRDKSGCAGSRG